MMGLDLREELEVWRKRWGAQVGRPYFAGSLSVLLGVLVESVESVARDALEAAQEHTRRLDDAEAILGRLVEATSARVELIEERLFELERQRRAFDRRTPFTTVVSLAAQLPTNLRPPLPSLMTEVLREPGCGVGEPLDDPSLPIVVVTRARPDFGPFDKTPGERFDERRDEALLRHLDEIADAVENTIVPVDFHPERRLAWSHDRSDWVTEIVARIPGGRDAA
jgi:hypothetical protein